MTLLQFKVSEILQEGTKLASLSNLILSIVNRNDATNPLTAPTNIKEAVKRR
jgi:hypothetical protein